MSLEVKSRYFHNASIFFLGRSRKTCQFLVLIESIGRAIRLALVMEITYDLQYDFSYMTTFNFLKTCLPPVKLANNVSRGVYAHLTLIFEDINPSSL
jgi:hypothetical protein